MSSKKKTAAIKEEAGPALVPKLRFPEFRSAKEWDNGILDDLSEVVRGGSPRPIDGYLTADPSGLNWLKIGDVDKEDKYVTRTAEKVRVEALSKTRVVKPGDLILSNSMSFGRPYILQIETCIHDGWIAITDIAKKTDRDFLYYFISSPGSQHYFIDNAAGSGVQNLNADIIKALPVRFPKSQEQQKIAEFLSSVDDLIAAQARKVVALKTHKKGLMHQLFPRESEAEPRLRFAEFKGTGAWKKRKISTLLVRKASPVCVKSEEIYREIGIRSHGKGIFHKEPLSGKALGDKRVFRVEEGAFVLNIVFAWEQAVAVTSTAERGMIASHRFPMYKPNMRESDVDFIKFYFLTNEGKELLKIASPGGAGRNKTLGQREFEKLEMLCPQKIEEQIAIARCLSSADAMITAETHKLEAVKAYKKGLMQQLFPSPEAVEG